MYRLIAVLGAAAIVVALLIFLFPRQDAGGTAAGEASALAATEGPPSPAAAAAPAVAAPAALVPAAAALVPTAARVVVADLGARGQRAGLGAGLGRVATPDEVARVNISIQPDGRNLPLGQGTVAEGAVVFAATCVACHGEAGAGGDGMVQLTGGIGTLTSERPVKTVASFWPYATTAFDYIRRAMPLNAPQSLTDDQVYAVTAYLLSIDGIVDADAVLNAETLPTVAMPNRNGFVSWWPPPQANATP